MSALILTLFPGYPLALAHVFARIRLSSVVPNYSI